MKKKSIRINLVDKNRLPTGASLKITPIGAPLKITQINVNVSVTLEDGSTSTESFSGDCIEDVTRLVLLLAEPCDRVAILNSFINKEFCLKCGEDIWGIEGVHTCV